MQIIPKILLSFLILQATFVVSPSLPKSQAPAPKRSGSEGAMGSSPPPQTDPPHCC
ncbi:hypothetical protein PGT21_032303 [Puccinia graminis f. sp. tritici]|uniref:Uncharacterized protein n=1 Tax=Puccinia graminis f. sp. tritici TaxID=56615 RepID=A0A5B0R2N3_PUCGR|nr:hypothetical protein PGT21_032303 [Puccinia graminis f. sp. tritici]